MKRFALMIGLLLCCAVAGAQNKETQVVVLDKEAEFPGGTEALMRYVADHLQYPKMARKCNIEGKVYVEFVVEKDGSITNVVIKRDIGGGCGAEVVRVVKGMPRWSPGELNGERVRSKYTLPVIYKLNQPEPSRKRWFKRRK